MKRVIPAAAIAAGMLSLAACTDDSQMAENYMPADTSGYPTDRAAPQSPATPANPPATDTGRITPPTEPNDAAPAPGAPPPTLPVN